MKVAYVTTYDPMERYRFSGLGFHILKALENQGLSILKIGPLHEKFRYFVAAKERLIKLIFNKRLLRDRELIIAKNYASQVEAALTNITADIVFSPGTIPISFLNSKQPLVFWTDASFAGMVDFYPEFNNLSNLSIVSGNKIEQKALDRSSLAIYSSEWAAETAIKNYRVHESKVKVVPFGPNFESKIGIDRIKDIIKTRSQKRCTLLFIGVDWERKGGDIALKIAVNCNRLGLKTDLLVVGCEPIVDYQLPEFVKTYGYIDKSTKEGRRKIQKIYAQSHFFVMPSRADCTPVVFSEANSYGLPCISSITGGIPSIIKNDINGWLFDPKAVIADYCNYILKTFRNYSLYTKLALSAYEAYRSKLNWNVSGEKVKKYLDKIVYK